ncbi:hypothetical protein LY624_06020 [Pseudoalteromonas sp. N1230-9]|uniref:phage integrase n=1 Tax=unclassified Pseudoalteromonas TaxID=194690 RepID=UPI0013EEB1BF|nr:hypothetical protein LY624_06020 [Pseudoalteromonas sp. N1230-9]
MQRALAKLEMICEALNNPIAMNLQAKDFVKWRGERMSGETPIGQKQRTTTLF